MSISMDRYRLTLLCFAHCFSILFGACLYIQKVMPLETQLAYVSMISLPVPYRVIYLNNMVQNKPYNI